MPSHKKESCSNLFEVWVRVSHDVCEQFLKRASIALVNLQLQEGACDVFLVRVHGRTMSGETTANSVRNYFRQRLHAVYGMVSAARDIVEKRCRIFEYSRKFAATCALYPGIVRAPGHQAVLDEVAPHRTRQ